MMERIGRTIDLSGVIPHIFRHSYATLLNDAGVGIKSIQSIIGHSDVQMTINCYIHSSDVKKREVVRSVNELTVRKYKKNLELVPLGIDKTDVYGLCKARKNCFLWFLNKEKQCNSFELHCFEWYRRSDSNQ